MLNSDQSDERCYDFMFLFLSIDVTSLPSTLDLMSLDCWLMFRRMRSMLRQAICSQCDAAISLFASVEYIPQDGATLKEPLVGGPLELSSLNVYFLESHLCVPSLFFRMLWRIAFGRWSPSRLTRVLRTLNPQNLGASILDRKRASRRQICYQFCAGFLSRQNIEKDCIFVYFKSLTSRKLVVN
jgi:hypothetical protein